MRDPAEGVAAVGLDPAAAQRIGHELGERFRDVCREVAIVAGRPGDHARDDDRGYGDRVFLRHYGVHLAGPDLVAGAPAYAADARAARGFNGDIAGVAAGWREALAGRGDELLPGLDPSLTELLAWAEGDAVADAAGVRRALDGPVARVTAAFAATVGLWTADRQ